MKPSNIFWAILLLIFYISIYYFSLDAFTLIYGVSCTINFGIVLISLTDDEELDQKNIIHYLYPLIYIVWITIGFIILVNFVANIVINFNDKIDEKYNNYKIKKTYESFKSKNKK